MLDVFVGIPYAKVEFATEKGSLTINQEAKNIHTQDLAFDILSIETKRDVGADDCPTFTIVLVYKEEWFKQIHGNDLVKIDLGRGKKCEPVFYGMVDTVYRSWSYSDLTPTRTITVSGRGFNKAFIQFGIGAVKELDFTYGMVGFFDGQSAGYGQTTPAGVIKTVIEYYMDKGIDISFANGKSFKDYVKTIYLENEEDRDESLGNVQGYYEYQGGLWDYLKELRNAPFYEAFWEIVDGKPTFITRPTPFNPDNWKELKLVQVEEKEIIDEQTGRSDLETYSVFSVKGESIINSFDQMFGQPIWYKPFYKRYGLRRLEVVSKYHKFTAGQGMDMYGMDMGAMTTPSFGSGAGGQLALPLNQGTRISSKFGMRIHPIQKVRKMHNGVDLTGKSGDPIYAAESGIVQNIGFDKSAGYFINIQHNNGLKTKYFHMIRKSPLKKGQQVTRGQVIGNVGSTGGSTGPHLHFEVHKNGQAVDPAPYIGLSSSGKGGKGAPEPYTGRIQSVKWEVNEKKKTKYEERYEEGKKIADELKRSEADQEAEKVVADINEKSSDNLQKAGLNSFLADVISENTNKELKDETKAAIKNKAEEEIALANSVDDSSTSQKTIDLFNWNIKNNIMENGTVLLRGNTIYQVGTRLLLKSSNMEYYIENVTHSFVYNEGWTTNLAITRGLPYGDRFTAPWNEWELITPEDLQEISGIDPSTAQLNMNMSGDTSAVPSSTTTPLTNVSGLRARIGQAAKAKQGELYSNSARMSSNRSDCSSFVYKRVCEALGKSWENTWAPNTRSNNMKCDLWYEIPMSQVQPWDILWRSGHTEFLGDDGKTFGAHSPKRPAGPGAKFNPSKWTKAYRVIGL